jgi:hypothetical protein
MSFPRPPPPRTLRKVNTLGGRLGAVRNPEARTSKGATVQNPLWDLEPRQQPVAIRISGPTCMFLRHLQWAQDHC